MHTIQLSFKIDDESKTEDQLDLINSLLGAWRLNGQLLGRHFPIAQKEESLVVFIQTPDRDTLSSKYNNKYVSKYLQKLEDEFSSPEILILGVDPDSGSLCKCKSTNSYILYTTYLSLESPLKCGECFCAVPLYKIPKTDADDYHNIISWMSDYKLCDSLQMNCSVGERFATDQLSNLGSPLTKLGLEVCTSIQKESGKKTYYYLYKGFGKSYESEASRLCPSCNCEWYREETVHDIFDFKCEECRLLSNVAWSCR